jgi:GT2 family glycosyltransferase
MNGDLKARNEPGLSIVVPVHNCRELTEACFESLLRTVDASVEIVVVDDASDEATQAYLATLGGPFRVIRQEVNQGYAKSVNRGVADVRTERVLVLNNDTVLTPGWLEPMIELLDQQKRVGAVGNVQVNPRNGLIDHAGVFFDLDGMPTHAHKNRRYPPRGDFSERHAASAACLLMRTEVFRRFSGFDEAYRNGMEDIDLCVRLCEAGFRILVSHCSIIIHHVSQSPGRHDHNEENTLLFASRRAATAATWGRREWPIEYLRRYARYWWRINPRLLVRALGMMIANSLTSY